MVNESVIKQYARQLSEEVEPQILELLSLADRGLKDLERTRLKLQAKVESMQQQAQPSMSATSRMEMRRLNMIASQRERLKKEADALEMEIALLVCLLVYFITTPS
jgi:DASH complex subunit SPC19